MTDPAPPQTVLFVEDDDQLRLATVQALDLAGFAVRAFAGAHEALAAITPDFDGVVVSDIRMPRMDGLQLLAAVRAIDATLPVILVTGHGDVPLAVSSLKDGAFDFLTKPFATDHLAAAVRRGLERRSLLVENRRLRAAAEASEAESPLIGNSPAIVRLRATIRQLAEADVDVLIEGETGTGKELVAAMLHRQGARRQRPLVAVDCAALTDDFAELELFGHAADSVPHTRASRTGRIVASADGTLLLDTVECLSAGLQAKLLRVIEEREVHPIGAERPHPLNLRVVATSICDLAEAVAAGRFRADLYHRLALTRLRLPPLREREGDTALLFAAFVEQAKRQLDRPDHMPSERERRHVMAQLWPGNVRELRNFAFESVLAPAGRDAVIADDLKTRVGRYEAALIVDALQATHGRIGETVERLGIPRKTFYDKLSRYEINPAKFRDRP